MVCWSQDSHLIVGRSKHSFRFACTLTVSHSVETSWRNGSFGLSKRGRGERKTLPNIHAFSFARWTRSRSLFVSRALSRFLWHLGPFLYRLSISPLISYPLWSARGRRDGCPRTSSSHALFAQSRSMTGDAGKRWNGADGKREDSATIVSIKNFGKVYIMKKSDRWELRRMKEWTSNITAANERS